MFGIGNNSGQVAKQPARSVKLVKDNQGLPAVSLDKVTNEALKKKVQAVGVSLRKRNLSGIRGQVVLVLDHSGSMYGDYEDGVVQNLTERFLGFGLQVDVDGEIPVIPFDSRVKPTVNVNMSNYSGIVNQKIWNRNDMGGTDLTAVLDEVLKLAKTTDAPLFVGIITDGEPYDRTSARNKVIELANYPVFLKFIAVQPVTFLEELDDMDGSQRLLDNVDSKFYTNVASISDEQFADDMADEWDTWTSAAVAAGILTQ